MYSLRQIIPIALAFALLVSYYEYRDVRHCAFTPLLDARSPATETVVVANWSAAPVPFVVAVNATSAVATDYSECPFLPVLSELAPPINRSLPDPEEPELCITFLSCRRYDLLDRTMSGVIQHIEKYEANLTYEIAYLDQYQHPGCTQYVLDEVVRKYQVNKYLSSWLNYGYAYGLNTLEIGMCRAPYVLNLEEDFLWEFFMTGPAITNAIKILKHDPRLIGILLSTHHGGGQSINDTWAETPEGIKYRISTGDSIIHKYVGGGTLHNRQALLSIGMVPEKGDGELLYKTLVSAANYTSAWMVGNFDSLERKESVAVLNHIGGGRTVSHVAGRPRGTRR